MDYGFSRTIHFNRIRMEERTILTNLKILIIGESGVGKSSLLLRFTDDAFDPEMTANTGVDFKVRLGQGPDNDKPMKW